MNKLTKDFNNHTRHRINFLHLSLERGGGSLLILLCGLLLFLFYQFLYPYHFYYQEQNQLFLQTGEYVCHYFSKPAWLSCLAGDWLTQYYYYRFAGPAILAVSLCLLGITVKQSLLKAGIKRFNWLVALLLMLVFAAFTLHYSYQLSSVLSALGGTCLSLLAESISKLRKNKIYKYIVLLIPLPLSFWMFGNGWMLYALLLIVGSISKNLKKPIVVSIVAMVVMVVIVPFTKRLYYLDASDLYAYPGIGKLVRPEFDLDKDFGVETEYRLGNWDNVVKAVESTENPTKGQLFFYNLVQAQRGKLPDVLLKYPDNYLGTFDRIGPTSSLLTVKRINELYWALGDMTFAERAALQAMVFSPDNRNAVMTKRLAEVNLVTGDTKAANKYLRLLDKTAVYHSWAQQAEHNPMYEQKAQMSNKKDTLRVTDNAHLIMMELLDSNPNNIVALDYLLCSDLLLKDITNFKRDYDRYCMNTGHERICPLYQQALMIWLAGTNAKPDQWQRYIKLTDQMQRFMQYNQSRGSIQFADTYWYWFDTHKAEQTD